MFKREKRTLNNREKLIQKYGRLKWFCRSVVFFAGATSVWANVLHAKPGWVAVGFAAAPPSPSSLVGKWLAGSRSRNPRRDGGAGRAPWPRPLLPLVPLVSYLHEKSAVMRYTEDIRASYVLPALVDGLMIIASVSVMELNHLIQGLEAAEMGQAVRLPSATGRTVQTRRVATTVISKKEKVAQLLDQNPTWTVSEIAERADASYGYVYQLVQELRKANGAELVSQ